MNDAADLELTETERNALHELQLGIEHVYRGYGSLLEFHHSIGRGMNRFDRAESKLREAGHTEMANAIRDRHLPAGVIDDAWTYELVDAFDREFLTAITTFEVQVRDELADGRKHVTERRQQRTWRDRAEGWMEE